MDTKRNKLVNEEELLDDDVLEIEVGDNSFSMPPNVDDLLDNEVGAGVSGQQLQAQPAKEKDDGEQSHPDSESLGKPKDQKASISDCKQGCQSATELAKIMKDVLSRIEVLEADNQALKSESQTLRSQLTALGIVPERPRSDTAKVNSDLAVKRANEGVKPTTRLSEVLRQRWVSYYDIDLKPPLTHREACDYIGACGWPADLLANASTASVNDVACGISRLYFCQNLSEGIDERHHYISWNSVTKKECIEYIIWAAPCFRAWLESLQSEVREELFSSYKAGNLDINLAKQPGAAAQEVFLKAIKRKKSKSLTQGPKLNDLEGVSSKLESEVPPAPMVQCQDQQPQVESEQPQDTGPAAKVAKPSEVVQGPSDADKYKANRRRVTKTWRNSKIAQGHWEAAHVKVLCTSLKQTLHLQGVLNYPAYEEEVKLMAYQVITTCRENRDEAAYQAQVAQTAKTPPPASPGTSSSAGPSSAAMAAAPSLIPRNHTIKRAPAEQWISRDIRPHQATYQPPDNSRGGYGNQRGHNHRGNRGGLRGHSHNRTKGYRGGPYNPRSRGRGGH